MSDAPLDRRPIAARDLKGMQAIASWMARKGFSANGISVAGMIFGALAGVALFLTPRLPDFSRLLWLAGAAFIQLRLLANLFDGMVAIERGTASKVGELYNEVPDRVSDSATLLGLGYAAGGDVLLGFGAALAAMMTAYVRAVGKGAGAPNEFCGPMAKQQRMFLATVVSIFCAAAPAAWQRVSLGCCTLGLPACVLIVILAGSLVTVVRRLLKIGARLRSAA
jgi:phosphatidylglycerophosphate synthase